MTRPTPPPVARTGSLLNALGEALRHIGVVMAVGIILATVFTAWTPSSLLPGNVAEEIAAVIATSTGPQATATALPVVATLEPPKPKIGIVAGHNGPQSDPGATCPDGVTEAMVNRDIAVRVQAGLEANGFAVDLLDEFDARLEGYQALAVVSIHNDSCTYINEFATGFKVAGALDTGAPAEATRLVACLTDRYAARTGLSFHANTITPDMTSYHTFYEVNATTPIAIIETGFLNLDFKLLTEEPQRVAQGVIEGILCYALNEPVGPAVTPPATP
jgi:N-acetylmuramoyl-L-alanine amidase